MQSPHSLRSSSSSRGLVRLDSAVSAFVSISKRRGYKNSQLVCSLSERASKRKSADENEPFISFVQLKRSLCLPYLLPSIPRTPHEYISSRRRKAMSVIKRYKTLDYFIVRACRSGMSHLETFLSCSHPISSNRASQRETERESESNIAQIRPGWNSTSSSFSQFAFIVVL